MVNVQVISVNKVKLLQWMDFVVFVILDQYQVLIREIVWQVGLQLVIALLIQGYNPMANVLVISVNQIKSYKLKELVSYVIMEQYQIHLRDFVRYTRHQLLYQLHLLSYNQ